MHLLNEIAFKKYVDSKFLIRIKRYNEFNSELGNNLIFIFFFSGKST